MNEPCRRRPLLALRAHQAASEHQQPEAALHEAMQIVPQHIADPASTPKLVCGVDASAVPAAWDEAPKVRKKPGPKPGSKRKAR